MTDDTMASEPGGGASTDGDEAYCSACGASYAIEQETCPVDGTRLVKLKAQPDPLLGRVFDGRYEVRMALGQGGMGTVYRGWQLSVDREVAIKVIHPKLATDRIAAKRFLREARLSSRLSQPSVVNVYDFGQTDDGILYIVMELLRGHTLARELDAGRPLPLRRVATIGVQLCDALDAAHAQGIIHRDLKPGNIVILDEPPGRDLIKVLDFGLAKSLVGDTSSVVTHTNAILGTPLYMPPEQIENQAIDQRADLYALGCILYQMVAGRPPFVGDNVNLVLAAHLSETPPPLPVGVPHGLVATIDGLMAKSPAQRLARAALAREALQGVIEGGYGASELADTTPDVSDGVRRARTPTALAVTDPAGARPAAATVPVAAPARGRRVWLGGAAAVLVAASRSRSCSRRARGSEEPPAARRRPRGPTRRRPRPRSSRRPTRRRRWSSRPRTRPDGDAAARRAPPADAAAARRGVPDIDFLPAR